MLYVCLALDSVGFVLIVQWAWLLPSDNLATDRPNVAVTKHPRS